MGTGTFRASHDGAQIVGIAELITDHQKRRFAPGGSLFQKVVNGIVFMGSHQSDNALMGPGYGHLIQLPAVHRYHPRTGFLDLGSQALQALIGIAVGDKHLVDGAAGFQRFGNGVTTLELALNFFHRLGALCKAVGSAVLILALGAAFFIHNISAPFVRILTDDTIITAFPGLHNWYFPEVCVFSMPYRQQKAGSAKLPAFSYVQSIFVFNTRVTAFR